MRYAFALSTMLSGCAGLSMPAHFNDQAKSPENRGDDIMKALAVVPGSSVADLGAGGGYFAARFARAVGNGGTVYAVDVDRAALDYMRGYFEREGVRNVEIIEATADDSKLPAASVDLVFVRDVYHHLAEPTRYFHRLAGALRPGGQVAIIDYLPGGVFRRLFGHHTTPERIIQEMEAAGFERRRQHDFLPEQSFLVFARRQEDAR